MFCLTVEDNREMDSDFSNLELRGAYTFSSRTLFSLIIPAYFSYTTSTNSVNCKFSFNIFYFHSVRKMEKKCFQKLSKSTICIFKFVAQVC